MAKVIKFNKITFQNTRNVVKRHKLFSSIQELLTDPDSQLKDVVTDELTGDVIIILSNEEVTKLYDSIQEVKSKDLKASYEINKAINPHMYNKRDAVNDN